MNKIINLVLAFLILVSFTSNSYSRDQIKIVGSSTVYPYATVVAEKFGKSGKFKTPVIESTGTGGGMKLFCAGVGANHPDITNASRAIKEKELALCAKNGVDEIIEIVVGNDGISLAHAVDSPDADFTKEQLWRALAHEVDVDGKLIKNPYTKWNEIDASLPNKKIEILIAPPTSGTRHAWNSLVMVKGCSETANKDKVKAASIEGVQPSLEGIQDYSYPIARPLFFYVKKAHIGVIPGIQEYLKEFTSKKAMSNRGYLADIGLVPLASDKYKVTRTAALDLNTLKIN